MIFVKYAHLLGYILSDISAFNIMKNSKCQIKLIDFEEIITEGAD